MIQIMETVIPVTAQEILITMETADTADTATIMINKYIIFPNYPCYCIYLS